MLRNTEKGRIKLKTNIPRDDTKIDISDEEESEIYVKSTYSCRNRRKTLVKSILDDGKIETAR